MATFSYKAFDKSGSKIEGQIDASNERDAITLLQKQELMTSEITEVKALSESKSLFTKKVSLADLEFLTSELSLLLQSGVRIDKGIDIIRRTKAKPELARMLADVSKRLKSGASMAAALEAQNGLFSPLYCNLVGLGEASGNLPEIFDSLAKDLKFKRDLRNKVISALTYPAVIMAVCLLSIFFIFKFVIPRMSTMFNDSTELPWYTQLLISLSNWVNANSGLILLAIFSSIIALVILFKNDNFVSRFQQSLLSLPFIRDAIRTLERIRYNSGLAMMLKSGVLLDKGMELSAGNIGNKVLRQELVIARKKVKSGESLTKALQQTSMFPDFFVSLIEVGEESGNLERVFEEIAERSKQEFERFTERVTTLIEPLMILFMGGFVGGIVIVMLMSMVSINDVGI
jgi:type II secretory pathway component PulF